MIQNRWTVLHGFRQQETEIDTVAFDVPHYIQTAAGFQKAMTVSRYVELRDGGKEPFWNFAV